MKVSVIGKLISDRLLIQVLRPRDAAAVTEFLRENREYHAPWEPTRPLRYYARGERRADLRRSMRDTSQYQFGLILRDRPRGIVGLINFSNIIHGPFRSCFLGYRMAERYTGRGLMTEALAVACRAMFVRVGLHRIEANIMPRNTPSLALIRKLGFRYEGRSARYLMIQGRWEDHDRFALLAEDVWPRRGGATI